MTKYIVSMLRLIKARPIAYPFFLFIAFPFSFLVSFPIEVLAELFRKWDDWNDAWLYDFKNWLFNK